MVTKKQPKPKARMGRPPKSAGGAAEYNVGLRLAPPDKALLEAILADEQVKLRESGIMSAVADLLRPADLVRSLIREEAKRRGLPALAATSLGPSPWVPRPALRLHVRRLTPGAPSRKLRERSLRRGKGAR